MWVRWPHMNVHVLTHKHIDALIHTCTYKFEARILVACSHKQPSSLAVECGKRSQVLSDSQLVDKQRGVEELLNVLCLTQTAHIHSHTSPVAALYRPVKMCRV